MPMFRVCIKEQLPNEECIIEAADAIEAVALRFSDLVEWAEMVKIEAEPAEEAIHGKAQPHR